MERVRVQMLYYSEDAPGFGARNDHQLTKIFNFEKLPPVGCSIEVKGDCIKSIPFRSPSFNPTSGLYTVQMSTCEGVSRYYHGNAKDIMSKVMEKYKQHGWSCKKLAKQETR